MGAAADAPGQVLGHERRLQSRDEAGEALEMPRIQALGGAERQPDAVDRDRIVAAEPLQRPDRRPAAHVVLGVDLEPANGRVARQHLVHVRAPEPDPGTDHWHP